MRGFPQRLFYLCGPHSFIDYFISLALRKWLDELSDATENSYTFLLVVASAAVRDLIPPDVLHIFAVIGGGGIILKPPLPNSTAREFAGFRDLVADCRNYGVPGSIFQWAILSFAADGNPQARSKPA